MEFRMGLRDGRDVLIVFEMDGNKALVSGIYTGENDEKEILFETLSQDEQSRVYSKTMEHGITRCL